MRRGDGMNDLVNPNAPRDKSRQYALPERERRFLLAGLPGGEPIVRTARITDNYLLATRLRIRRWVETADGATTTVFKLTQKVPAPDGGPGLITTFYLNQTEYEVLAALPARQLHKTRYSIPPFSIDVFDPPLHGLTMAEAEFASDEALRAFVPPSFAIAEVTADIRFTGGCLATTTRDDLLRALASVGIHPAGQGRTEL
jgi:CYTH domain-containing protein